MIWTLIFALLIVLLVATLPSIRTAAAGLLLGQRLGAAAGRLPVAGLVRAGDLLVSGGGRSDRAGARSRTVG